MGHRKAHRSWGLWQVWRKDERALLRSLEGIEVLDFGAGCPKEGRISNVEVGYLARRASSDLRKGYWLSASAAERSRAGIGQQPVKILELGTCLGSGAAQLLQGCNGRAQYFGLEGSPALAHKTEMRLKRQFQQAEISLRVGPFSQTLGPALDEVGRFDLVFLDGHHSGRALLAQWKSIRPHLAEEALVVVDDIRWSQDMFAAWNELAMDRGVETLDVFRMGLLKATSSEIKGPQSGLVRPPRRLWS